MHPASAWLANESAHIEDEAAEHDLHAFQAIRRMDEILVNNFMVFHDVVTDEHYDLVIGDEAWDVDYFLHENPELKRFAFAWMTDFVGWLPMPDGGDAEAALTADYNAEMIEQRARYRRLRDRSIFVGDPDDIVPDTFGAGPARRSAQWTEENFDFAGYVTGFDPAELADREALRAELGYRPDERVCVVTVGGSGVGGDLLRRVIDAAPAGATARRRPALRRRRRARASTRARCPGARACTYRRYVPDLLPPPRRLRPRRRAGRADDVHGADRQPPTVHLRAAAPPLRAELPRRTTGCSATAPAAASTTTRPPTPTVSPRRSPTRSAARSTTAPSTTGGAARAAASLAQLV